MKADELAREATKTLEPLRVSPVTVSSIDEARQTRALTLPKLAAMIEALPRQQQQLRRRRRMRSAFGATAGAMAAAAALALVWMALDTEPELARGARQPQHLVLTGGQVTDDGRALTIGSSYAIDQLGRLSTPEDRGAELTAGDVRIGFAPASTADLAFARRSRRIALNRGEVELDVPRLEQDSSLSVTTPNAVVTVHGTRFSVSYAGGDTCVRVREGVVSVLRGARRERLGVGESSGCQAHSASASAGHGSDGEPGELGELGELGEPGEPGEPGEQGRDRLASGSSGSRSAQRPRGPPGTLTQENALFRRALAAEQVRDLGRAEANLQRLLERYPDSPLSGEARRVLGRVHAARAGDPGNPGNPHAPGSVGNPR